MSLVEGEGKGVSIAACVSFPDHKGHVCPVLDSHRAASSNFLQWQTKETERITHRPRYVFCKENSDIVRTQSVGHRISVLEGNSNIRPFLHKNST